MYLRVIVGEGGSNKLSFVSLPYSFKIFFKYLDDKHLCDEYSFTSNAETPLENITSMKKKVKIIEKSKTNNNSMLFL